MAVALHNIDDGDESNDCDSALRQEQRIELAVVYLVHATIPSCWGRTNTNDDIMDFIVDHRDGDERGDNFTSLRATASLWKKHAPAIRRALDPARSSHSSCPLLSSSLVRMMRGLSILIQDPLNDEIDAGWQYVMDAIDDADRAWSGRQGRRYLNDDYNDALYKLTCFTIQTACFLASRPLLASPVTSIINQGEHLLHDGQDNNNTRIRDALLQWRACMQFTPPPSHPPTNTKKNIFHNFYNHHQQHHQQHPKPMWREDKALLDIFFARLCAAVVACGPDHRRAFSDFFTPYLPDTIDQERVWRENLCIYKMSKSETIGVAALPAAALLVADPLLAVVVAVGSVPWTITRHAKVLWTKPLYIFDDDDEKNDEDTKTNDGIGNGRRNFYHWRTVLQRSCRNLQHHRTTA